LFFHSFTRTPTKSDIYLKQRDQHCDIEMKPSSVAKTCSKFGEEIPKYRFSNLQILMSRWIQCLQIFYPSRTEKCRNSERSSTRAFRIHLLQQHLLQNWHLLIGFKWRSTAAHFAQNKQRTYFNTGNVHLYYFVLWSTNTQLFHILSHFSMFRHYRVILKELAKLHKYVKYSCW